MGVQFPEKRRYVTLECRDADCSDFIGSFPIFAYPFRHYDNIELSSDFLGDLIIYFLVHFISHLLVEPDDFPVAVIKRRLSLATC